mmetsp:Transcript_13410/g.34078  ORF Transcript_13410/g.34078 Transcript_13410/m.34078 type:complete len:115 (+) Transcript_13410:361-705(+)
MRGRVWGRHWAGAGVRAVHCEGPAQRGGEEKHRTRRYGGPSSFDFFSRSTVYARTRASGFVANITIARSGIRAPRPRLRFLSFAESQFEEWVENAFKSLFGRDLNDISKTVAPK